MKHHNTNHHTQIIQNKITHNLTRQFKRNIHKMIQNNRIQDMLTPRIITLKISRDNKCKKIQYKAT